MFYCAVESGADCLVFDRDSAFIVELTVQSICHENTAIEPRW
jgi:hypothetical protein